MNLEQIADRLEIGQRIQRYSRAIDALRFDQLDEVFSAGARMIYTLEGFSFEDRYPQVRYHRQSRWLEIVSASKAPTKP